MTIIVIYRVPTMTSALAGYFENDAMVWMSGGILLGSGLAIIAFHQLWRGLAAILVSLFGWFLAIRGAMLMAVPELIERGVAASTPHSSIMRGGFALLTVIGLYLTYFGWVAKPKEPSKEQKQ